MSLDELAEGLPPEDIADVHAAIAALKAGDRVEFERIARKHGSDARWPEPA